MSNRNGPGNMQAAVIQTALEFFRPYEGFTAQDIVILLEGQKENGNALGVTLIASVKDQVGGILLKWSRGQTFHIHTVQKMVLGHRLIVVGKRSYESVYAWYKPGHEKAIEAVAAARGVKVDVAAMGGSMLDVAEAVQPPFGHGQGVEHHVLGPNPNQVKPSGHVRPEPEVEILLEGRDGYLIKIRGEVYKATPFEW